MLNQSLLHIEASSHDERDLVLESINQKARFPRKLDYMSDLPPVWDQGADGPCSAYAAAAIKSWQERRDYGLAESLSKYFIYNMRSNYPQKGMTPRDTMKLLQKYGMPTARSYNKRKMKHKQDIPDWIFEEAANHRIAAYARVMTIDGLKESLYKNGPAYIAMPVFNVGETFWKPGFGDTKMGGHALTVVGYNKRGFILRNSWGINWGNSGHTLYPYTDFGAHYEIWTAIDEPGSSPDMIPPKRRRFNIRKLFASIFNR